MVPFWVPKKNTGPNLGDTKKNHNFDNLPYRDNGKRKLLYSTLGSCLRAYPCPPLSPEAPDVPIPSRLKSIQLPETGALNP